MKIKLGFGIDDDVVVMKAIRRALGDRPVTLMIATDHAYGAADALDIAQTDVAAAGGSSACRHVAAMCPAHGIQVNPHVWGAVVAQRASLHLIASLPVANPSLFPREPVFEYDCSDHPFRRVLVDRPVPHANGWIAIDDRPGLGIEVNREALRSFSAC